VVYYQELQNLCPCCYAWIPYSYIAERMEKIRIIEPHVRVGVSGALQAGVSRCRNSAAYV